MRFVGFFKILDNEKLPAHCHCLIIPHFVPQKELLPEKRIIGRNMSKHGRKTDKEWKITLRGRISKDKLQM